MHLPLIAIDGPAGVGKTSTSQQAAWRLGLPYLDTGALYRAAAWAVLKQKVAPTDAASITLIVGKVSITYAQAQSGMRVWVDGTDVTTAIRQPEVNRAVSPICEVPQVRAKMVDMQRRWAARGYGIMEGRDIGTVVLPDAGLKIYFTARPEVRALRRGRELGVEQNPQALEKLAAEIAERDRRDSERPNSPLRPASDSVVIDVSDFTFEEQVNIIIRLASERFGTRLYTTGATRR